MPFNGSGTFSINTPGQPVVAGTAIAATYFNDLTADLATGLSTALLKDGTQTVTANIPMAGFKMTGLGAGTVATDAANISNVQGGTFSALGTVAGTNTITAAASPAILAYATGQLFRFVPANTNTGATTLNINSVAAKSVFWNNAACVGGELQQNVPVEVYYDGTQFQLVGSAAMLNGFSVPDSVLHLQNISDRTKQAVFSLAGLTTGTTRTFSLPDATDTLAGIAATQTFSNKTYGGTATGLTFDVATNTFNAHQSSNVISGDVALNNTGTFFAGPTLTMPGAGTWIFTGYVTVIDTAGAANFSVEVVDSGASVFASAFAGSGAANQRLVIPVSGPFSGTGTSLTIKVKDVSSTSGAILSSASGLGEDSRLTVFRIG